MFDKPLSLNMGSCQQVELLNDGTDEPNSAIFALNANIKKRLE